MTMLPTTEAPLARAFPGEELMAMEPSALSRLWLPAAVTMRQHARLATRFAQAKAAVGTDAPSLADLDAALARLDGAPSGAPVVFYEDDDEEEPWDGNEYVNGVGVVTIEGPLLQRGGWWWDGYAAIVERFRSALTSPKCRVVLLRINSPGGVAMGCFEAARLMAKEAAEAGVPVLVYCDEMACSAGYALACVAAPGGLWLPASGCAGSVGVIATYLDASQALDEMGLRYVVLTSGRAKADGSSVQPITDEMVKRLQVPTDHLADLFFAWVAERRATTPAAIKAKQANVYWGATAVSEGLADRVAPFAECLAAAERLAAASHPLGALAHLIPSVPSARAVEVPMSDPVASPAVESTPSAAAPAAAAASPASPAPAADTSAAVKVLEATLAERTSQLAAVAAERDALARALTEANTKLAEANAAVAKANEAAATAREQRVTAKVKAMLGVKFGPAELDLKLKQALRDESEFDAEMAVRPDLALNDRRLIADLGNEQRASDSTDGNVARLNKLADEHLKANPGCSRTDALKAVMKAHPELCGD